MGNSFFGQLASHMENTVGLGRSTPGWGRQLGPNAGPYAGVDPSLAGANAGYGGAVQPGAVPMARPAPMNPYVAAARTQAGT
jgi:hypothetical protein